MVTAKRIQSILLYGTVFVLCFFIHHGIAFASAPSEPQNLTLVPHNNAIELQWDLPLSDGGNTIDDYLIEYKENSSFSWAFFSDGISSLQQATVTGLTNGTVYDFRVYAETSDGMSSSSNIASETPKKNGYLLILSTGQSLALGTSTGSALSTTQPYENLSLSSPDGPLGYTTPLIPLIERIEETPSSGMANTFRAYDTNLFRPVIVGLHAGDGMEYDQLKKGTYQYDYGMTQVTRIRDEVITYGSDVTLEPLGVTVVHGETDYVLGTSATAYQDYLEQWQEDYQDDVNTLLGRSGTLPLFVSQMNTAWTGEIATAQYTAHRDNPDTVILVGPQYQYDYIWDNLHLTSVSSKHMGELFAKVMKKVAIDHESWSPLMPTDITRTGRSIVVDYHIPEGSLAIDTTIVAERPHYGFDFVQTGGNSVTIDSVQLIDNDTKVEILLSDIPTGTDQKLRYAWGCYFVHTGYGRCGDREDGDYVGGNIRDTDSSTSPANDGTGRPLYDWGVSFEESIDEAPEITHTESSHIGASQVNRRVYVYLRNKRQGNMRL